MCVWRMCRGCSTHAAATAATTAAALTDHYTCAAVNSRAHPRQAEVEVAKSFSMRPWLEGMPRGCVVNVTGPVWVATYNQHFTVANLLQRKNKDFSQVCTSTSEMH